MERVKTISALDAVHLFFEQTGVPEMFLRDDLLMQFADVRSRFASQIIGQPDATLAAAREAFVSRIHED
jgi:hypothetical protein